MKNSYIFFLFLYYILKYYEKIYKIFFANESRKTFNIQRVILLALITSQSVIILQIGLCNVRIILISRQNI